MSLPWLPLACDGCFQGYPAVISLVIIILALIGTIYVLVAVNLGWREGYLVVMVSLMAWMIMMSALWIFGLPGTPAATGPRGREPAWIPFLPDSEQAGDYRALVESFPSGQGWEVPEPGTIYKGGIDPNGELENIRPQITTALARLAEEQELDATDPGDWDFTVGEAAEGAPPPATIRFSDDANEILIGVTIPATDDHREVTVFAYRDKGLVFLQALIFLVVSIVLFALHFWLLVRYEVKRRDEDERLGEPALA